MALSIGTLLGYLRLEGGQQFQAGTRAAQESLDLTATAASRAGVAVDKAGAALMGAGRQSNVAASGSAKFRAAQLQVVAAQERYNTLVNQGDAATGRLASAQASLIRSNERLRAATPVTPETIGRTNVLAGKFRSLTVDALKMGAGFAVLGGMFEIGNAIRQANDFQRQMLQIHTQAGATTGEVDRMTKAVLALAPAVGDSPEHLATSLYHIESVGLRGARALDVLKVAAEGAKVGNANLEDTTNALTSTVASGIKGAQAMSQAMGALNAIVGSGDMKLQDLNEALGSGVLAVVKGYGLSLRDVGAALATFGDNNIRGAEAATMLRMAVQAMSQPAKEGQVELEKLGLRADTLRKDMQTGGLDKAVLDLNAHLKAAGVTGSLVGGTLTEVFGKRAGPGLAVLMGQVDRLQSKYGELDRGAKTFGEAWSATTHTAAFGFDKLKASAESSAVSIFGKVGPVLGEVASDIGVVLPSAVGLLEHALAPLGVAFGAIGGVLKDSGGAAKAVADALHAIEPIAGTVGAAVVGMWLGFKVGETVVAVFNAVKTAVSDMAGVTAVGLNNMVTRFQMMTAEAEGSAAEMAGVGAASKVASAEIVASGETASIGWAGLAGPIGAAAIGVGLLITMFHKSKQASQEATDSAKAYSSALGGGIDTGSASVLGAITSELSKNNVAQKITDLNSALGSSQYAGTQFVNAIAKGEPALTKLRSQLETTIKTAQEAETNTALNNPAPQTDPRIIALQKQVVTAKALLTDLNTQYKTLTDAAAKDLADTQAFSGVSASIDQVSASTQVGSDTAKTYAAMMGIFVDKNGIAAVSADVLTKAVNAVSTAEDTATQTGSGFLSALQTFSASAATASDRAALIGATLKAANGDALNYVGAMAGAAAANTALVQAFQSDRDKITQLNDQLVQLGVKSGTASLGNAVLAATINSTSTSMSTNQQRVKDLENRLASGKLTATQAAAVHRQLANAQASGSVEAARLAQEQSKLSNALGTGTVSADKMAQIQKKLRDAYADSELAAINLNQGTIDYTKTGAAPLVQQLQSIQDAAVKAASATYQHELATKKGKVAADEAYNVYVNQTRGALIDEAKQLGITAPQAQKLADTYFNLGNAPNVKKTIEMEGTDPILTVLNKIGELLATFTGQPWNIQTDANTSKPKTKLDAVKVQADNLYKWSRGNRMLIDANASPALSAIQTVRNALGDLVTYTTKNGVTSQTFGKLGFNVQQHASGGFLGRGMNLVGEQGPEMINGATGQVFTAQQTQAMKPTAGVHIDHFEQKIINPIPERAADSTPRAMRAAALALSAF